MKISNKITTGMVSVVSLAALAAGAAPAGAAPSAAPQAVAAKAGSAKVVMAPMAASGSCTGWKKAGSLPLKWSKVSDNCGHFGKPGLKMGYTWKVYKGSAICVKVRGFVNGKDKWYDAGCGKSGAIKVPWGNVLAAKEMKVKNAALFDWK
ncbi:MULTISPECIES: hypothetical protein [Streptomyces]|uniref:Uncharacterized protein n=1 Tax=Streptomyces rubrolavendulae TaxID=285473 RepID=A0A1D8FXN9_9ACTN|nr:MULTISPECIES: hypothetical protein [Streptomyces]AOT57961.1 hypothetical protein A4G23_00757 [Streptomyces rubrolavendulae]UQS28999.1 hypothetical protein J5J01_18520 [Streptomyces fradiae]